MQIVLLVAMIAVAGAALYVAFTFRSAMRSAAPLMKKSADDVAKQVEGTREGLAKELQQVDTRLQEQNSVLRRDVNGLHERLTYANGQLSSIASQLAAVPDAITDAGTQAGIRHEQFSRDLRQRLDDHVVRIGESLARLEERLKGTERDARDREARTAAALKWVEGALQGLASLQSADHDKLASITAQLDRQTESGSRREDHDLWAAEQMAGMARQVEAILSRQGIIEGQLQAALDYVAAGTARDGGHRLVAASVCLAGPGADLLWPLLLSFARAVRLGPVTQPRSPWPAGSRSYLLWPALDGPPLEDVLRAQLAACASEPAGAEPGLAELRSLVLGLHGTGPGTVRLGPMVINRTPQALLGTVTAAGADPPAEPVPVTPDAWETALRGLAPDEVTDLTSWAEGFR